MTAAARPTDAGPDGQGRMLRMVTRSFCREVLAYGAGPRELVQISGHVLDFVSAGSGRPEAATPGAGTPDGSPERLCLDGIRHAGASYEMGELGLRPLAEADLPLVQRWVSRDDIRSSMLVPYPTELDRLREHMAAPDRAYHLIAFEGEPVGLVGAEDIDRHSRRLEMRKLIGEPRHRGRGIGTRATVVWLYHVFHVLAFNKVYIHTHHVNVRNVNLNRSVGFELEGILREERCLDGAYVDILRMGLLRRSWMERTAGGEGPRGGARC